VEETYDLSQTVARIDGISIDESNDKCQSSHEVMNRR
jgi:hypothetical protein